MVVVMQTDMYNTSKIHAEAINMLNILKTKKDSIQILTK